MIRELIRTKTMGKMTFSKISSPTLEVELQQVLNIIL